MSCPPPPGQYWAQYILACLACTGYMASPERGSHSHIRCGVFVTLRKPSVTLFRTLVPSKVPLVTDTKVPRARDADCGWLWFRTPRVDETDSPHVLRQAVTSPAPRVAVKLSEISVQCYARVLLHPGNYMKELNNLTAPPWPSGTPPLPFYSSHSRRCSA